ncbi:putative disease resistance protein At3g14460 [Beta vulgaris subsp. vulgaris]|uniref:putative disease resistance protein At3g14460 n=1 Tax=Beta vulgaris subsp. vulgaris TaxID=3555 RepID=UPI002036F344|nr:putative disease resistance protein At3g14460 [Beta vulgaris subsp. vulgaris]
MFPKGEEFAKDKMIFMWMADGFLPEINGRKMEDTGNDYFLELVSRSLYEPHPSHEECFIMHDLIHDLAQWAAGDICCSMIDSMEVNKVHKRTRHMFVRAKVDTQSLESEFKVIEEGCSLRTFAYPRMRLYDMCLKDLIQSARYLRVLDLSYLQLYVLPECIGDLKHLRLLNLSSTKTVKVLPESTSELFNLQTLLLDRCRSLQKLPANSKFLISLRHLRIEGTALQNMPVWIGKLTNLQTLDKFVLEAGDGSRVSELRELNHLHDELRLIWEEDYDDSKDDVSEDYDDSEEDVSEDYGDSEEDLSEHNDDSENDVSKHDDDSEKDVSEHDDDSEKDVSQQDDDSDNTLRGVLEQLKPNSSIKKFELKGYRGLTLPAWLGDVSLKNMVDIKLVRCEKCEWLPPLGQLPLLKNLCVKDMDGIKQVSEEFYGYRNCSIPFPALRALRFEYMRSWEKWVHSSPVHDNRAFPCLEELSVLKCPSLQGDLPPHFPSLETLQIKCCRDLSISLPCLPLLEKLRVERCKVLSTSADVIFCSEMYLERISEITGFPGCCPHLRDLEIGECNELKSVDFSKSSSSSYSCSLDKLYVRDCKSIVAIGGIPLMLQSLVLKYCEKLQAVEFDNSPYSSSNEKEIILKSSDAVACSSSSSSIMGSTREAALDYVASIQDSVKPLPLYAQAPSELLHLTNLHIVRCPSLISLPPLLIPSLEELQFWDCENMEGLPTGLHNFTSLRQLRIVRCPNINQTVQEWGSHGLHLLHSLDYLYLIDVGSCVDSTHTLSLPPSLYELGIEGFQNLKSFVGNFSSLQNLTLKDCPKFCYFSGIGCLPRNLTHLVIQNSVNIEKPIREWGLHHLTSLESLTIFNLDSFIDDTVECIAGPDLYLPSSLRTLRIKGFANLKSICYSALPNLNDITIRCCPKFESLGDNGRSQLKYVHIYDSDQPLTLSQGCLPRNQALLNKGEELQKLKQLLSDAHELTRQLKVMIS